MRTTKIASETALYADVVRVLQANNGVYINDHSNDVERLDAVGNVRGYAVGLHPKARYYSINELYVHEDGLVHLSRMSIAGTVMGINENLDDQITAYNAQVLSAGKSLYPDDDAEAQDWYDHGRVREYMTL